MTQNTTQLDPHDAANVKMVRALTDPIISPYPDATPDEDTAFVQAVTPARLSQVQETTIDERIELATWPETAIYCLTAATHNAAWARGTGHDLCIVSFREALEQWLPEHRDHPFLNSLNLEVDLVEPDRRRLNRLRKAIKRTRDEVFLEETYPEMETETPKSFWKPDGPLVADIANELVDG